MPTRQILDPIDFTTWQSTQQLFGHHIGFTETYVFDGPHGAKADVRVAYGRCAQGFWFFVSMTRAQEAEFKKAYESWRKANAAGFHHYVAAPNGVRPPTCGTPTTPPCVVQVRPTTGTCGKTGCLCAESAAG